MPDASLTPVSTSATLRLVGDQAIGVGLGAHLCLLNVALVGRCFLVLRCVGQWSCWLQAGFGRDTPRKCVLLYPPYLFVGECLCYEGYMKDPVHKHLCIRNEWGTNQG